MGRNIGGSDASQQTLPVRSFHLLDGDLYQYLQTVPNNKLNAATWCHAAAMLGTPQMAHRNRIEARTICPVCLHLSHVTLTFVVSCPRSYSAEATACTVCCKAVHRGPEFSPLCSGGLQCTAGRHCLMLGTCARCSFGLYSLVASS